MQPERQDTRDKALMGCENNDTLPVIFLPAALSGSRAFCHLDQFFGTEPLGIGIPDLFCGEIFTTVCCSGSEPDRIT